MASRESRSEIASTRKVIEQQRERYERRIEDARKAGDRAAVERATTSVDACNIVLADLAALEADMP